MMASPSAMKYQSMFQSNASLWWKVVSTLISKVSLLFNGALVNQRMSSFIQIFTVSPEAKLRVLISSRLSNKRSTCSYSLLNRLFRFS